MNASSKIRSKTAHGDCCSTVKRGTDQYGNGVCIMPRRPTCSETILPRKPIERPAAECSFKKITMSLTAMTRENALLESSTESNSAPSGTGIDLGDLTEFQQWEQDRSGTLGCERANGGCETPVVYTANTNTRYVRV